MKRTIKPDVRVVVDNFERITFITCVNRSCKYNHALDNTCNIKRLLIKRGAVCGGYVAKFIEDPIEETTTTT